MSIKNRHSQETVIVDLPCKLIRFPKLQQMIGVSRSTFFRWCRDGRFPKSRQIGPNVVAWDEKEVIEWMNSRKGGN